MENSLLEYFDKYLKSKLNADEQRQFEKRLTEDAEFKKEFEEYLAVVEAVGQYEREKLKKYFSELKNRQEKHFIKIKYIRIISSVAAVFIIVFVTGLLLYQNLTKNNRLYNKFYIKDSGIPVFMGNANDKMMLNEAMTEFKDENYQACLNRLKEMENNGIISDTVFYYAGLCYLNLDNASSAIEYFTKVKDTTSAFYFASKYYIALSYLKNDDLLSAESYLKEVVNCENCFFKEKAGELLKEIGKNK